MKLLLTLTMMVFLRAQTEYTFEQFYEVFPDPGQLSDNKTLVKVSNNETGMIISVLASGSSEPYGSVQGRDESLDNDDYIEVIFDNNNQKSNGLVFQVNPLGTKRDYEISENGANKNYSWNSNWNVKVQKTKTGWIADYFIPFSILRFNDGEKIELGFKVNRYLKHSNKKVTFPYEANVSQIDYNLIKTEILEIDNLNSSLPIIVKPYVISNTFSTKALDQETQRYENESSFMQSKSYSENKTIDKILSNIGLDVKYKLDNQTHFDISLNTDFSTVENDDQLINLDRYSLYLPEKRDFFIESSSLFDFDLLLWNSLFYSRKVGYEGGITVPLVGGLRFVSNGNSTQLGGMIMQSNEIEGIRPITYSTGRIKQLIGENGSFIGVMYTGKTSSMNTNHSYGVDSKYIFSENTFIKAHAAAMSEINSKLPISYGVGLFNNSDIGYNNHFVFKEYKHGFNPDLSFVTKQDRKMYSMWNGFKFFNLSDSFSKFDTGVYLRREWDSATNEPLYLFTQTENHIVLNNGADIMFLLRYINDKVKGTWQFSENVTIPEDEYHDKLVWLRYYSGKTENYSYKIDFIRGTYFGGKRLNIWPSFDLTLNQKLKLNAAVDYNYFTFPEHYGRRDIAKTAINLKINYSLDSKLSVKVLSQYSNESGEISSNFRLRYNPVEGTDVYFVYNQIANTKEIIRNIEAPNFKTHNFVLKFTKTLFY